LLLVEDQAAMLRFLAAAASTSDERPDPHALSGIADVCAQIAVIARGVRRALSAEVLGLEPKSVGARARRS
jgi:hypothetical protein